MAASHAYPEPTDARSGPVRQPIAPDRPTGEDLTFDPEFELISREIEKLERVDGTRPDWQLVEDASNRLLVERTKDFRLGVWGAAAKVHRRKWVGLGEGLGQCLDLAEPFWEKMFPPVKRARARANLFEWFSEQSLGVLEGLDVSRADEATLKSADHVLHQLDSVLADKLGDLYSGSMRLRTLLRRKIEEIPPPTPPPPPPPATPPPPPTDRGIDLAIAQEVAEPSVRSARRPSSGIVMPTNADDARQCVEQCENVLLECARLISEADLSDAQGFRLRRAVMSMRFARWSGSPEGPDAQLRAKLAEMATRFDVAAYLVEAEQAILAFPAWLDAHRMSVEALEKLGPRFAEGRQVVAAELLSISMRLPALATTVFRDATAVADARTQEWIQSELRRAAGASAMVGAEDQEMERRYWEVTRLAQEGRVPDAVTLAIGLANRAGDARGRFRGYLLAGKTALDKGHPAIARPLLEGLQQLVDRHQLETWEPSLCVVMYGSLLACIRALSDKSAESSNRERDLFDKLCRLDPAAAMRMGGSS